jgi:hypothetical protein
MRTRESYLRDIFAMSQMCTRRLRRFFVRGREKRGGGYGGGVDVDYKLVLSRAPGTSCLRGAIGGLAPRLRPVFGTINLHHSLLIHWTITSNERSNPLEILSGFSIMSDIPVRPPAPAPPLPPGWTEHKAPSGSYIYICVIGP